MPDPTLIHITATWSNAVLVALLPHFSDCSKQLNLPIPTPITMSQVDQFHPPIETGAFEAGLWLTNGYTFFYLNGAVTGFNSMQDDWFVQQDVDGLERFVGKDNMTTDEAVALARNSFVKLGYKPADFQMDVPPTKIEGPYNNERLGHIPYCRVTWEYRSPTNHCLMEFDVNMNQKRLSGMALVNQKLWRPLPKLDVTPELESDYQKNHQSAKSAKMYSRTNAPPTISNRTNSGGD